MSPDEWTFVRPKNNRRNRKHPTAGDGDDCKHKNNIIQGSNNLSEPKEREHIRKAILQCMSSLEQQYQSGKGFAYNLFHALKEATRVECVGDECRPSINLTEIVVYGIGNFSGELHSAPMLQLAAALLLRRLARKMPNSSFLLDQQLTPIFYYEPCMIPVEKELLEEVFQVHVLESNEMGKLPVSNMRQQFKSFSNENDSHTLFFMPHCPMRLYCNVIWSHWDHIIQHAAQDNDFSSIIIFGNSFHAYEDRLISLEQRMDPTNGVFSLVPYSKEEPVYFDSENKNADDSLKMLDRAFNDCNVISFSTGQGKVLIKPQEYFPFDDPIKNGELL